MKFELEEYHRGVKNEELIADLQRVALELNKTSVSVTEYDKRGKYGKTTFLRRFGSWFNALEKAGLQKTRTPSNLPEEELYKNLGLDVNRPDICATFHSETIGNKNLNIP